MLRLALGFELRGLLRSGAGLAALLGFLAAGSLAIVVGQQHVAQWQQEVATAEEAGTTSAEDALRHLEAGETGPEDRPWVNLAEPGWQDHYAGSRIAREPGPLAGIAAGAVDPAPATFQLSRSTNPLSVRGYRIENPELAVGAFDLVFVLSVLTPLLIGVLGVGIGGRERESGLDRLIVVQAGELRGWLVARAVAVTLIAGIASATLCIAAAAVGGASVGAAAVLVGLATLYTGLWGGLLLLVSARAPSVRHVAFRFGLLWTVLCVLMPAWSAELAIGRVEADFGVEDSLEARALVYEVYDQEVADVLPRFYGIYPKLRAQPAAEDEELARPLSRHVHEALIGAARMERHRSRSRQEAVSRGLAERVAWMAPPVALSLGLERLAGVGVEAAAVYRDYLVVAVQSRLTWVLHRAWAKEPLTASDFRGLLADTPPSFQAPAPRVAGPLLGLLVWALGGWGVALIALRRT